ncbi:MAG: CPBP family intramembrane metalloprotease [Thermoleophilaceae bacterium]|nr:CPBP family intramembrane metalloprotease [Thermoleophilaceae bacterium]
MPPGFLPPAAASVPPPQGPVGNERWGPLVALMGILGGMIGAILLIGFGLVIATALGGSDKSPAFSFAAAVVQDGAFVAAAWLTVATLGPVHLRDFGLLRTPLRRALLITVGLGLVYVVLAAIYGSLVHLKEDTVPEDLGADKSALGMIGFVWIAVVLAPAVEEFFFRGFIYKALSNRLGVVFAALLSSVFFGMLHWDFSTSARLLAVVPLTLFGVILVMTYYYTGSIYPGIALHATNNTLAAGWYAHTQGSTLGVVMAVVFWLAMLALCVVLPRFTDPPQTTADPPSIPQTGGGTLYA